MAVVDVHQYDESWLGLLRPCAWVDVLLTMPTNSSGPRYVELLSHVGQIVSSANSLDAMLKATLEMVQTMLDVGRCSVMFLDNDSGVLRLRTASHIPDSEWDSVAVPMGEGIAGTVVRDGQPLLITDISTSPYASQARPDRYTTSSCVCVPLMVRGRAIGVLNATNANDNQKFGQRELEWMTATAAFISLAFENSRLYHASENSRLQLEHLIENLPAGLVTVDLNHKVGKWNPRFLQMFDLHAEDVEEGKLLDRVLPPKIMAVILPLLQETAEYGVDNRVEFEFHSRIRGPVMMEMLFSGLAGQHGEIDSLLMTTTDISFRQEIAQLRRIDELKSNFLAMVSHELRTPLTSIKGSINLLTHSHGAGLTDEQRGLVRIVENNSERLARLVADLLDVTNIENHSLTLECTRANLGELAELAVASFRKTAEERRINLETDLIPVDASVDSMRLGQAIAHLVDNAIKFTKTGGTIQVATGTRSDKAFVSVRDSGEGIPTEFQPHIFDKFFQIEHHLTRSAGGTGIGLYIARSLVTLHGGDLRLAESGPNGSEFLIELPLTK
ncbi:MAG: GAF domain-containing protein [Candidatus Sumerlaeaceae bacterium]|nr:GAF domain-containing protein [Candidatus Sumerlaeaceae bacterium]